jgi:DNA-directed RNA polymerase beta subunit
MNYRGFCHEDSYTITEDLASDVQRTIIKPLNIVIPPGTKILNIEDENKYVDTNDILVEFVTDLNLEDYLKNQELDFDIDDTLLSQNSKSIKLHAMFSGQIVGMKIFLNTRKNMDQKLLNLHKKLVDSDKETVDALKKNKSPDEALSSLDNLETAYFEVGGHTLKGGKEFLGANVVFYIREQHSMSKGDKLCNRFGAKGVVSYLIGKDVEPYAQVTELKPQIYISPISIFSRKNIPFLKEIYIGKILHFLQIQVQKMANDTKIPTDKIIKKIVGVFNLIASEKVYKQIEDKLNNSNQTKLRQQLKDGKLNLRLIVEPFTNLEMEKIKQAADLIEIPLDEKVFIPELGAYTDVPVPVGIGYYLFQEHISEDAANIRGADVYTGLTRQPTKGKLKGGGQSISGQDIYALLSLDADNCLKEFLTARSDDHVSKRKLYTDILSTGELATMPKESGGGGTTNLFNLYMRGMGMEIE